MTQSVTDANFEIGKRMTDTGEYRDRYDYDRYKILLSAIEAWRVNPIAHRGIELTTQFVIGSGITIHAKDPASDKFLADWQADPVNQLTRQLAELADELWRSGNLFMLCSVDDVGMTYWRPIPAEMVGDYDTMSNDPYSPKRITLTDMNQSSYPALKRANQRKGFTHYAINRPAGGIWGESDLAPILRWISIYTEFLIDRAATNKMLKPIYIRQRKFNSPEEKKAYANDLKAPRPGTQEVLDATESLGALSPMSNAFEAGADGENLRRMIYAGFGFPAHYFAEPEGSTRTTAEAAGTPTYRRLQDRQRKFCEFLSTTARHALRIRAERSGDVDPETEITVNAPDISERDNAQLSMSASRAAVGFSILYDRGLIEGQDLVNAAYQFAGETENIPSAPKNPVPPYAPKATVTTPTDEETRQQKSELELEMANIGDEA